MTYRKSYSRNGYSSSSRRSYSSGSSRSYSPTRSSSRRRYSGTTSRSYSPSRSRNSYSSNRGRSLSTRTKNGYSQYYDKHSGSWKFTHRRVAEKKLGGSIRPGYEVHHKNHNKKDNRASNLTVLSKPAHRAIHRKSGLKRLFKRWKK